MLRGLLTLAPIVAWSLDDSSTLVQHKASTEKLEGISCKSRPEICHDGLFNCEKKTPTEEYNHQITKDTDGHPNPHTLCSKTLQVNSFKKCIIDRDLDAHAEMMFKYNEQQREFDATYCFAAGHCNNTAVKANTTLKEAEAMCDQVYGRGIWSGIGYEALNGQRNSHGGRKNPFAHVACAEGRWHCDVHYCREMICKEDLWRYRFGMLSWWTPGSHWQGVIPAAVYRKTEASPDKVYKKVRKSERKHQTHL
uniref:Uncharacterized protein n=1 Tax=Alexandrium catenella TaxID=2925 RepID=A0A7S1RB68_ALECA|mmetsp:Transcript_50652/g.135502  ORF Transcript_50652/g.135502 Transcript_50652/m.135502 type:complete len:251 (+) Transcript_50652:87-839(+)